MPRKYDQSEPNEGDRFGKLVVIRRIENRGAHKRVLFKCDCGKEHPTSLSRVRSGKIRSCGCAVKGRPYPRKFKNLAEAIEHRIDRRGPNECWPWTAAIGTHGYGVLTVHYVSMLAHRAAYEVAHGPIPAGFDVLHTCDNRPCCNPDHHFLGSDKENIADKVAKRRHYFGEMVKASKLTVEQAEQIFQNSSSHASIARDYSVSHQTVSEIKSGKTWALARALNSIKPVT